MNDQQVDEALEELGYGTLSLARENEAYGVPISFGYDGDRLFLYLIRFGDKSKKIEFSEQTDRATMTAFDVKSRYDWKSVVVSGTLHEVDDVDYMEEVMDDNAWHPSLYANTATSPMTEVRRMEIRIEEISGRNGDEYLDH